MISDTAFWILTVLLGVGTFVIRFAFLGLLGGRRLPDWLLVHLRYTGVAVFPALVTPLVLWPAANGGDPDPVRIVAAAAALLVGLKGSVIGAIVTGMGTLYALQYLFP